MQSGELETSHPLPKQLRQLEMLLKLPNLQGLLNMDYVAGTLLDLHKSDEIEQVLFPPENLLRCLLKKVCKGESPTTTIVGV